VEEASEVEAEAEAMEGVEEALEARLEQAIPANNSNNSHRRRLWLIISTMLAVKEQPTTISQPPTTLSTISGRLSPMETTLGKPWKRWQKLIGPNSCPDYTFHHLKQMGMKMWN
jgi:CO/xanthine dehydrogenase Mo-binding subunit